MVFLHAVRKRFRSLSAECEQIMLPKNENIRKHRSFRGMGLNTIFCEYVLFMNGWAFMLVKTYRTIDKG